MSSYKYEVNQSATLTVTLLSIVLLLLV